jgi:ribonuclease P protein component
MLAAAHRVRSRRDFAAAMRAGRRSARGTVVVHFHAAPPSVDGPGHPARAGFVVPRAVGGAVTRNLVRRRLQHLVRLRLDALPPGATLVVRALPRAALVGFARLDADLDAALRGALGATATAGAAAPADAPGGRSGAGARATGGAS